MRIVRKVGLGTSVHALSERAAREERTGARTAALLQRLRPEVHQHAHLRQAAGPASGCQSALCQWPVAEPPLSSSAFPHPPSWPCSSRSRQPTRRGSPGTIADLIIYDPETLRRPRKCHANRLERSANPFHAFQLPERRCRACLGDESAAHWRPLVLGSAANGIEIGEPAANPYASPVGCWSCRKRLSIQRLRRCA